MGRNKIQIILSRHLQTMIAGMVLICSCTDGIFSDNHGQGDGNTVRFYVTSGLTPGMETRAQSIAVDDTTNFLHPLLLRSPELEEPLYLHTYVAEENERSTGVSIYTRGQQVNDTETFRNLIGDFNVAAYEDNGEFIKPYAVAKPVQNLSDIWSTSPAHFWPNKDFNIRFYAYALKGEKELLEDLKIGEGKMSFDYIAPHSSDNSKDAEEQPDVMLATALYNKKPDGGIATLNFRHALSAIKFAVRDVVGGTIEKITISGVKGSGHCEFLPSEGGGNVFTWSGQKDTCSYSQTFGYETKDNFPNNKEVVINNSMPSKTFMLIPQELTDDAAISIVFKRSVDNKVFTLRGKIIDNTVNKWEPGKEYIYTISTSSSNWTYHFEVLGCEQAKSDDNPSKGTFKDSQTSIIVNQTVTTGAYYKVKSYRERANNPNYKEAVAWHAETSKGTTVPPSALDNLIKKHNYTDSMEIHPSTWMPKNVHKGEGKADDSFEKFDVEFYPQMVGTDYDGDWELRKRDEVESKNNPKDLSMIYGKMNTANCYVVSSPGYFKFPVVYGNAITDGKTNASSYTYSISNSINKYPPLNTFTDYNGKAITGPKISEAKDAILVWSDAYNIISDVKLTSEGGYNYVNFKVNKLNLQQGNVVLAIRDTEGKIMWSWHIWINENWANQTTMELGNGDVEFAAWNPDSKYGGFTAAPYNLGWCDPKNVWYLKRVGTMTFTQENTGNGVTLNVEQREKMVEYWIGNNTYYQFGRKDPIVGFMNDKSVVKYNFGEMPYVKKNQPVSLKDGIQNPNVLYVGANEVVSNNDWLSTHYYNLWNNTKITETRAPSINSADKINEYFYDGIKTVYDPSPAGYMVPPVGFFRIMTKGHVNTASELVFNGESKDMQGHGGYYEYLAYGKDKGKTISLTGTGHRWYGNSIMAAGANFNPSIVYLWSSQVNFGSSDYRDFSAYGLALGYDITQKNYVSDYRFPGRRAMARPVRPVKIK